MRVIAESQTTRKRKVIPIGGAVSAASAAVSAAVASETPALDGARYTRPVARKDDLAPLAVVLLLVLFFFADVLLLGKSFYIRDFARIYVPERKVLREILLGGELPFWNPHYGGGQPLAANPTSEVFYPPQWLILLPDFQLGVAVEVVIHFLLGAAGMFALLRSLRLRPAACAFGALTFALSGLLLSLASLLPCLFAMAWVPWLGFAVSRFLDGRRRRDFALAALILGIILLIGEPSTILQCGALLVAYTTARLRNLRAIGIAAALCVAATLVGAGQIIPGIDHHRDSGRAAGLPYNEVSLQSMAPARPLELIAPNLFGRFTPEAIYFWAADDQTGIPWLFSWYAGLLTAALIVAGFVHRIRGWTFVGAVSLISYLIALGRHSPLFPLLYRAGLRFIRYPEKWFMPAAFLLIVFAAIAADRFLEDARFRRTTFFVALGLALFAAGTLAFACSPLFARTWHLTGYYQDIVREARAGALTTVATAAALTLILFFRERPRVALPLLGAFVIADLGSRVFGLAPRIDRSFYDPPPIARALPPGARIYNDADWRIALLPQPRIAYDDRWMRMRNGMFPELQSLWGFDSVLEVDVTQTMLLPTVELSRIFWRAQLGGREDVARRILGFAGATHVIALRDATSATNPVTVVPLPGSQRWYFERAGRILGAQQSANAMDFDVETAGDDLLVVSVTRHKYWRATIDGVPAVIRPANVAFQAVAVPRGRHRVAFRYRNPLVVVCGIVSLISVLTIAAVALRSKGPPPPSPR